MLGQPHFSTVYLPQPLQRTEFLDFHITTETGESVDVTKTGASATIVFECVCARGGA